MTDHTITDKIIRRSVVSNKKRVGLRWKTGGSFLTEGIGF